MSENRGGDVLARGERSAQFKGAGANLTEFEYDLAMNTEQVGQKYGLSQVEIEEYQTKRANGEKLDLKPVGEDTLASLIPALESRFNPKPVEKKPLKFAEKTYSEPTTILDRILVKRIADDPDLEIMEDGSARNKRTGFVIPYAYRQHNNIGIVLAVGQFVILGGVRIPMDEVVRKGDLVKFGDYNSEVFVMPEDKIQEMCDAVEMNYEPDPEGLRVVRVQDVRTVQRPEVANV